MALADEDSGKLILTPVVIQKSLTGLVMEVAFRYPVTVTETDVLSRLKRQLPIGVELEVIRSIPGFAETKNQPK